MQFHCITERFVGLFSDRLHLCFDSPNKTLYFQSRPGNLCGRNGGSYCEDPPNYPSAVILNALRNQTSLVQTPGLFDSRRARMLETDLSADHAVSFMDNDIVPY